MNPAPHFKEWSDRLANVELPFRGGIAANCSRFRFEGDLYSSMPPEQDRHFVLATARQCAGPLKALEDDRVRVVHLIGATQVLKSMVGECWVIWSNEHERKSMIIYFEDDPKAALFCRGRLFETLKKHPVLAKRISESLEEDRHRLTGTRVKFLTHDLHVCGLNKGNTSTLSWPRVWVSEAWQHPHDGLLRAAFKRTDRYPRTHKILNESQASESGTDLHEAVKNAHPVPLEWACPNCWGYQTWEWHHWSHERPEDFQAILPRQEFNRLEQLLTAQFAPTANDRRNPFSSFNHALGIATELARLDLTSRLRGKYAGMRWDDEHDGRPLSMLEKSETARWECIHCGYEIQDTLSQRLALCDTYRQDYEVVRNGIKVAPPELHFTNPYESHFENTFKSDVLAFLKAKQAKEQGNEVPMIEWFLAWRAFFYVKGQTLAQELAPVVGSYETDPDKLIPNEHSRNMLIDVQKALDAGPEEDRPGSFWVIIEAVDKLGNSWDLSRNFVTSWEDLVKLQRYWKIPNARVCIDGRRWTKIIQQKAAENSELVKATVQGIRQFRQCWRLFFGDDAAYYKSYDIVTKKPVFRSYSQPHQHEVLVMIGGQPVKMLVMHFYWSNLAISDQLEVLKHGGDGVPKIQTLKREELKFCGQHDATTINKEAGDFAYEKQINAEYCTERRGKRFYEKKRPENHYLDCRKMGLVRKQMDGLAGGIIDATAVPVPIGEAKNETKA